MEIRYNLGCFPLFVLATFATAVTEYTTKGIYFGSETKAGAGNLLRNMETHTINSSTGLGEGHHKGLSNLWSCFQILHWMQALRDEGQI